MQLKAFIKNKASTRGIIKKRGSIGILPQYKKIMTDIKNSRDMQSFWASYQNHQVLVPSLRKILILLWLLKE